MSKFPGRYRSNRNFVLMQREAKGKNKAAAATPVKSPAEIRERAARLAMGHAADRLEALMRGAGYYPSRTYLVPSRGCWAQQEDEGLLGGKPTPPSELALRVLIAVYAGCTWRGLIRFDLGLDGAAHLILDGTRAAIGSWRDAPDALDAAVLLVAREQVGRHHEVCGGTGGNA